MPKIKWGDPVDRTYESGLDHGVLYLPDGSAVPWNGLISVVENKNSNRESVYFDGMKISDLVTPGDYAATLRAVTYPREFSELESMTSLRRGVLLGEQPPQTFGLSYRTMSGDAARGGNAGYKLHVVYNLTALPSDRSRQTRSEDPSLTEFEWSLTAVPEEIPGARPTAHLTFDSVDIDPWLMEDIEFKLYGGTGAYPEMPPMGEFVEFMSQWARVKIVDHGDGTWTATELRPGFIFPREDASGVVDLKHVNAAFIDVEHDTYLIADTKEAVDMLDIRVLDDGTWVAITENDAMIEEIDGIFTLYDVEPVLDGSDMFRIKSKSSD